MTGVDSSSYPEARTAIKAALAPWVGRGFPMLPIEDMTTDIVGALEAALVVAGYRKK